MPPVIQPKPQPKLKVNLKKNLPSPGYLLRTWFLTGLLAVGPVVLTVVLVMMIVTFVDGMVAAVVPPEYRPSAYLGFEVPGLGLISTLVGITIIGALVSNFFGRYFVQWWDKLMARVPIINGIYGGIKQVLNSILSEKGESFREVVYIEFPQPGYYTLGFVTGTTERFPNATEEMVLVFIPFGPVVTTGHLLTVPRSKIIATDISVEEGLKRVVTLGLVKKEPVIEAATNQP